MPLAKSITCYSHFYRVKNDREGRKEKVDRERERKSKGEKSDSEMRKIDRELGKV